MNRKKAVGILAVRLTIPLLCSTCFVRTRGVNRGKKESLQFQFLHCKTDREEISLLVV